MSDFSDCVDKMKLVRQNLGASAVKTEFGEAEKDLASAEASLASRDWKWAIVQSYYSMFHSARALVFRKGYREKSHFCLSVALRELFVKPGILDSKHADSFEDAMLARQDADYGGAYSHESAEISVAEAKSFLEAAKKLAHSGF
ncbi:HEPN domain protein [uncultured archaeon]|nr:HEPN domain protein [uncultured archaeon]